MSWPTCNCEICNGMEEDWCNNYGTDLAHAEGKCLEDACKKFDAEKEDCIFRKKGSRQPCEVMKKLYCRKETCAFYKSSREYNKDGTKKEGVANGRKQT